MGAEQASWLARLETEHDNLRTTLHWAIEKGNAEVSLRLVSALWRFWLYRTYFHQGRQWLEEALALGEMAPRQLRAVAPHGLGELTHFQRDLAAATAAHEQSLALRREVGDHEGVSDSLATLGMLLSELGDYTRAEALLDESLTLARELSDTSRIAYALTGPALNAAWQQRGERAGLLWGAAAAMRDTLQAPPATGGAEGAGAVRSGAAGYDLVRHI